MKKNQNFTVILAAALVLAGIIIITIFVGLSLPQRPDILQGEVETTDYRLSSKVPARVREIRVGEGDHVKRGDTLIILEAPDIYAKLLQAEAAYAAAQAQQQKAQNGTRPEQLQQAYEAWQKARAGLEVAEKTYRRISRLADEGVVPAQKLDEAEAHYHAASATERAAQSQYEMARNGARREDREAAGAQARRAEGAVSEVASYLEETVLLATADGVVADIFPEPGELVGTGAPLMNIVRTDDARFIFHVREDLLPGLTVGTEAEVYMPAFDRKLRVRVTRIKDVGTFAAWKATKALDGFDLKTFEVEARPLQPELMGEVRGGMTAVIER